MSSQLKLRRGSTVSHDAFAGADGEITFDTDTKSVVSHDGSTLGGFANGGFRQTSTSLIRGVNHKLKEHISVKDFGATGDGTTPDTDAIQRALDYAKTIGGVVVFPQGTYLIMSGIFVRNGVRGVYGQGGVIKLGTVNATVKLQGKSDGQLENVSNCTVKGLKIDAGYLAANAIWGQNVSTCSITDNTIYNLSYEAGGNGIMLRTHKDGAAHTYGNTIANNRIIGGGPVDGSMPGSSGIALDILNADLNIGIYADLVAHWKATFTAADSTYKALNNVIVNNVIEGSYYGISLSSASYNVVSGNTVNYNIRNISIQNCSIGNTITNNFFRDSESSAIHLAYGSSYNFISGNNIYSSRSTGQGMMQAYVGSTNNKFSSNVVNALFGANPKWLIYCGVHSWENEFSNNTLTGKASKAYIAVESAWNNASTNPATYGYGEGVGVNNFANQGMYNVKIIDNVISPADSAVPVIFINQCSPGTVCNLSNFTISGNKILSSLPKYQLELVEDTPGNLYGFSLCDNEFHLGDVGPGKYSLARGRAHFAACKNNTAINDLVSAYDFPSGTVTPNVAVHDFVSTAAYATPTTITNFLGGMSGQKITVRMSYHTTLQHNANVVLKGGVNAVGGSSNLYIELRNINGVWVEMNRNY